MSSSATNFVSSLAAPTVSTSVPQNYHNNNRSGAFKSNLQQASYQMVAYNIPPLSPVRTGVPYEPVPDSYVSGSPLQTSHAPISLPEFPPRACISSVPQTSSLQPHESFKVSLLVYLEMV